MNEVAHTSQIQDSHVIFVDDDPGFLQSMRFVLSDHFSGDQGVYYRFSYIDNPHDALTTIWELLNDGELVSLVVSDQKMPQMKGTEFLSHVREISPNTIQVLLTGYAGMESAIEAINNKLLDKYLTKPIEDEHDFIVTINHLLQRFQMNQTIIQQDNIISELYAFSNQLNALKELKQTLVYLMAFIKQTLSCDRVQILLNNELQIYAYEFKSESIKKVIIKKIAGNTLSLDQLNGVRQAQVVNNASEMLPVVHKMAGDSVDNTLTHELHVGLVSGTQPIGIIRVWDKTGELVFNERDISNLTYIANTAAIALHNQLNRQKLHIAYMEKNAKAAALEYQMTHDLLTALPSRTMLQQHLYQALDKSKITQAPASLLIMDIDQFKEVNDSMGHHNGDLLLQKLSKRLVKMLGEGIVIARLGGDEFAIWLENSNRTKVLETLQHIFDCLKPSFFLEDITVNVTASIGVADYPLHGENPTLLMQRAEVAMYEAKKSGREYAIYDPDYDQYNIRRLSLINDLQKSIEQGQLVLYYQPKINMVTGHVIGVEALVRWQHPVHGLMPPDQFIPLAEQTSLMKPLAMWVFNEAIRQCSLWNKLGLVGPNISMAVNLSANNLIESELPNKVGGLLKKWDVSPSLLELEITESAIMASLSLAIEILTQLSDMGVKLSIDDFGTGHSSLAYLKSLPVDNIKIDKTFTKGLSRNKDDVHIVQSTIELGHNLGFVVIAEGIEDYETQELLKELECDVVQGFYYSQPLSASEFEEWVFQRGALNLTCSRQT